MYGNRIGFFLPDSNRFSEIQFSNIQNLAKSRILKKRCAYREQTKTAPSSIFKHRIQKKNILAF